ncbi:MAG: hypothetical protein E6J34_23845 [Chloroflexi bacterium]|nr:MAG: hypothetical protein E6J34_23845 [Chloroflexota bacterium]
MRKRKTATQEAQDEQPLLPAPAGLLDVEGASQWLGISRAKLFELIREDKDFPVIRITDKLIRFDPNSLYLWALKRQKVG